MKKNLLMMLFIFAWITSLFAQITKEQAEKIVYEHIQNEIELPYFLYIYENSPQTNEISLTTFNQETIRVKYKCWLYYLKEEIGGEIEFLHRYILVNESNGNLLEIILHNDLGPDDLFINWMLVELNVNILKEDVFEIYPNPTTGELRLSYDRLSIKNMDIFDVFGRIQKIERKAMDVVDISHLASGIYYIKISTQAGEVVRKVIKL
jgi:hypothetical protein